MQAWSSFPVRPTNSVNKQTDMTKENATLSQSLNNRLSADPVFFVYDHNMLKKEEDDLKDAILYFSPEYMSADDQCALCGQLMGMAEFLSASISQSAPRFFKFDHEKFALKRIGSYSFGLQASVSIPDSVVSEQLLNLYEVFVTFHGSVDSVRLRYKESHSHFLKEFSNIWKVILEVSKVSLHSTLTQTFNNVPCVHLPKSGSHLFLQASHLLQASQRRPFVLAGAIFYKNKVLCTQLSPTLTQHLTFLQNQIPYIAKNTESDMPKGCKTITMFLTDKELRQITPQHCNPSRHCKVTNFHQPMTSTINSPDLKARKKMSRRLKCMSVPSFTSDGSAGSPSNVPEQSLKKYFKKWNQERQNVMGIEKSTWGRNSLSTKMRLSHVPLVEFPGGESPLVDDVSKLGNSSIDSNFGRTYQQIELSQHLDSFALNASIESNTSQTSKSVIGESDKVSKYVNNSEMFDTAEEKDIAANILTNKEERENQNNLSFSNKVDVHRHLKENYQRTEIKTTDLKQNGPIKDSPNHVNGIPNNADNGDKSDIIVNGIKESVKNVNGDIGDDKSSEGVGKEKSETQSVVDRSELSKKAPKKKKIYKIGAIQKSAETEGTDKDTSIEPVVNDISVKLNIESKVSDNTSENVGRLNETDSGCFDVSMKEAAVSIYPVHGDGKMASVGSPRVFSESELETEDEGDIVQESLAPCIDCLDLQTDHSAEPEETKAECDKCQGQLSVKQVIHKSGERQEVMDFGTKNVGVSSDTDDTEAQSDIEGRHFYTAKSEALTEKVGMSSFSSDVSTDSSISRYWTYEMEGLNDVTVYVQCHSEISLLLIMENPEQFQESLLHSLCHSEISLLLIMENPEHFEESLLHSLWKGSLNHLADLDYYITECLENEENTDNDVNYRYARFDAFSAELQTNIDDVATKKRDIHQQQMLSVLHSDFKDRHCLTDVTLRSHVACCYGHHREGEETFFQPELSNRFVSGLPVHKDPAFNLDLVAKKRLAEDKKITVL